MRLLRRTNLYTEQQSDEVRLNQLERRIMSVPTDWAVAWFDTTPQAVTSGGTTLAWEHFRTTDTTAFDTTATIGGAASNTAGDVAIRLTLAGVVLVSVWARFESGTFYRQVFANATGGDLDAISNVADVQSSAANAAASVDSDANPLAVNDDQWFANSSDFNAWFSAQAIVGSGQPNKNAISASLTVVLWSPSGVPWDQTEVY